MASNNNGDYIVGAALALIGLDRILSYLSTPAPPPPPPLPPKRLPVVCKHLVEIYNDFHHNYADKDSTTIAAFEKHCTLLGHGLPNKTIAPEECSTMPNPFDLMLHSYFGCMSALSYKERMSGLSYKEREKYICEKKYSKMLRQLIDAGKK